MMQILATAAVSSLLATSPFQLNFNHPYVQVRINASEPLWFILDTGAQVMVIDRDVADRIGLASEPLNQVAAGAGSETLELALARDVGLELGGLKMDFPVAYITPLNSVLAPHEGREVHGLLGYDFMSRFVVVVDHETGVIELHDPAKFEYANGGMVVPLRFENNHPRVRATISRSGENPVEGEFVIDTGATGPVYLSTAFVNAHGFLGGGTETRVGFVAGVGGLTEQPVGEVAEVRFGGVKIRRPPVYLSQDTAGGFAGLLAADGIIGTEILRRHTAIWDYSNARLILEPNAHFDEPFTHDLADLAGFYLLAEGVELDTIRVARVVPGGAADAAGIKEGDLIASVDGRPAVDLTLEGIRRLLIRKRTYRIQIRREGVLRESILDLAE